MTEEHAEPWIIEKVVRERLDKSSKRPAHLHVPVEGPSESQEGEIEESVPHQAPQIIEISPHGD